MFNCKAALFDMDGVIINSHSIANQLLVDTANRFGCDLTIDDIKKWGSLSSRQFWAKLKKDYNLTESLDYYIEQYNDDDEIEQYKNIEPINGVIDFIKKLKAHNIKLGLATSASKHRMNAVVELFNLNAFFNTYTCDEDIANSKPDPDIFLLTAGKLNVKPENCIVIEDSENGKIAAKRANMKILGFKGLDIVDENMEGSDIIFYNFNDLDIDKVLGL